MKTKQPEIQSLPQESQVTTEQIDLNETSTDNSQQPYRPASGRSILKHVGTWAGIEDIRIYRVTEDIATIYAQRKATLMKQFGSKEKTKPRKTKITELGFAAIALQHNLTIVSADTDFERIQQVRALSVESWL